MKVPAEQLKDEHFESHCAGQENERWFWVHVERRRLDLLELVPTSRVSFIVKRGDHFWDQTCDLCGLPLALSEVRIRAVVPTVVVHEACHALEAIGEIALFLGRRGVR